MAAPPGQSPVPAMVSKNRPLLLTGVMAAMIMQTLDTTIANVALPRMSASLGATRDTITWVLTSYVLASAVVLPLSGWLVDRIGIRRLMLASVLLFTLASMLCGVAQSLDQMVLFRILQGLAGAFLGPLAQTVILDSSTAAERPKMMALYTQGVMLGPISGPIIGGYLTDNYNWRWVFYVNLPVGIACFVLLLIYLPDTPRRERRVDMLGWLLIAVAVSALQLILDRGEDRDWFASAEIVIEAVLGASCLWMAIVHLSTARAPLFPSAMMADRNLAIGLILSGLMGLVMMSVMALLPGLLQQIYGYSALQSGVMLAPRGIGMLISITVFGRWMARIDPRALLALGLGLMAFSLWLMAHWSVDMPRFPIVASGIIQGVGLSFSFMPVNLISFSTLDSRFRADASGLTNLLKNVGSSIGIAAASVMLARNVQVNHAEIGAHVTPALLPFVGDMNSAFAPISGTVLGVVDGMVNQQAAMIAYLDDFLIMSGCCIAAIPLLLLVKSGKAKPGQEDTANAVADAMH
jgi:DHA2 family multidrug resistance protein